MRVHLAASSGTETSTLRKVLADLNAEILNVSDAFGTPPDIAERLPSFWRTTEAVIAVPRHADGTPDDFTLVDIGIALGKDIPTLALISDDVMLPGLSSLKIAKAGLNNYDALRFHVSLFLESVRTGSWFRRSSSIAPYKPLDIAPAQAALTEIRQMQSGQRKGHAYEEWAADIFRNLGATVESPPGNRQRGFDLVLSLPGFEQGPLLVEVKGPSTPDDLRRIALRLQVLVLEEQAGLGLVLFDDNDQSSVKLNASLPMVILMGMTEFVDAMAKKESVIRVLTHARNEAVHQQ